MAESMIGPYANRWQVARHTTTADTLLTVYEPSDFSATVKDKSFGCSGLSRVLLRAFGTDTENDTATVTISGWMGEGNSLDHGPGCVLWKGQVLLGAITWASPDKTYDFGRKERFPSTTTWFEVDTWNSAVAGGGNLSLSTVLTGNSHAMLLLNTLGYTRILVEVSDMDGANQINVISILWRPASLEAV